MSTLAVLGQIGPTPIGNASTEGPRYAIGKSVAGCARIVGKRPVVGFVVRNDGVVHVGRRTAIEPLKTESKQY